MQNYIHNEQYYNQVNFMMNNGHIARYTVTIVPPAILIYLLLL